MRICVLNYLKSYELPYRNFVRDVTPCLNIIFSGWSTVSTDIKFHFRTNSLPPLQPRKHCTTPTILSLLKNPFPVQRMCLLNKVPSSKTKKKIRNTGKGILPGQANRRYKKQQPNDFSRSPLPATILFPPKGIKRKGKARKGCDP